jgi:hypothetical protein
MIATETMMQKISEPGLWFMKSSKPIKDISNLIYELAEKGCAHLFVNTQYQKEIQREVIAKVMKDRIDEASDEDERNWLEREMSEYYEHGFFFYPEEMNDYVENGSFWKEDAYLGDDSNLSIFDYPSKIAIIEGIDYLPIDDESDLKDSLQFVHEDAIVYEKSVIVMVQEKNYESASDFIETNLLV